MALEEMAEIELDLSDIKEEAMHRLVRQLLQRRRDSMKPGSAAKRAKDGDTSAEDENDDLVELKRESKGTDPSPKVLESDLPEDVVTAMKSKKDDSRG